MEVTMTLKQLVLLLLVASFDYASCQNQRKSSELTKRQTDQVPAETGHPGPHAGVGNAKHFMYAHQPDKKQYEFGYKRGNDHHKRERYEKAGPKHNFKTKVRWHDSKGGHGERYWDYNHAPKHHDDGHHEKGHEHGGQGYHSEPVPDFAPAERPSPFKTSESQISRKTDTFMPKRLQKRKGQESQKKKSSQPSPSNNPPFPEPFGFDPYEAPAIAKNHGNLRRNNDKRARHSNKKKTTSQSKSVPQLAYDLDTGRVFDEKRKAWYKLVPVKN